MFGREQLLEGVVYASLVKVHGEGGKGGVRNLLQDASLIQGRSSTFLRLQIEAVDETVNHGAMGHHQHFLHFLLLQLSSFCNQVCHIERKRCFLYTTASLHFSDPSKLSK